ncbi:MAG: biotin/lipoyl-binding protein [Spirochaetales bacterium]|nr:MAG: biotin/lipoyl-binding protein [Spirochaetales bacterium]
MACEIRMPALSATMEEGTILAWRVKEGDSVKKGDILFEVESDKSVFEFESTCEGTVLKIAYGENSVVPVNKPVMIIGVKGESFSLVHSEDEPAGRPGPVKPDSFSGGGVPAERVSGTDRVLISPRAKKLAETLGIDIALISGSGPGGRIESADVEKAAEEERDGRQT